MMARIMGVLQVREILNQGRALPSETDAALSERVDKMIARWKAIFSGGILCLLFLVQKIFQIRFKSGS